MKKKLVIFINSSIEPSNRYRILQYVPYLQDKFEISVIYTSSIIYKLRKKSIKKEKKLILKLILLPFKILDTYFYLGDVVIFLDLLLKTYNKMKNFDITFIQRRLTRDDKSFYFCEKYLASKSKILIFDFDDAIFLSDKIAFHRIVNYSDYIIAGNQYLLGYIKNNFANKHVECIPTSIEINKYKENFKVKSIKNKINLGWVGTNSNFKFFSIELLNTLKQLVLNEFINVIFIADYPPNFDFDFSFIKWSEENEIENFKKIDIGIMPLLDTEWAKGKCSFKLIQYGGIGIPGIASAIGTNVNVIEHGVTGFLVEKENEWEKFIMYFVNNPSEINVYGEKIMKKIEDEYSIEKNVEKLISILMEKKNEI